MIRLSVTVKGIKKSDCMFLVTVQGLTGLKKTDGVNWETVKAIGFLYPNILYTLSKGTAEKTINTVFSAEHDYPQYKKIKIRHFLQ